MSTRCWATAALLAATTAVWGSACARRRINPDTPVKRDIEAISVCVRQYALTHGGRLPPSLGDFAIGRDCLVDDRIPIVDGSRPSSSYRYVPCKPDAPPRTVILYPNIRGADAPLYLLRLDGTIDTPSLEEYEREIKKLGQDYDSLPTVK